MIRCFCHKIEIISALLFFCIYFARPACLYCEECVCVCVYTNISGCVKAVYELLLLPTYTADETFLYKPGAVWSVDWIFIIGAPA